jgi:spermidine synthase
MNRPSLPLQQTWFFSLTIFISAFLLFQVQPMISKYILPWFGGGSSIWTTAQLFFQLVLVGGYGYAFLLSRRSVPAQGVIHLALAGGVLAWLAVTGLMWAGPLLPGSVLKPESSGFPIGQVLLVLLASVGLPYFLLSTTSSLIQSWFSRVHRQESPYVFYVLSNAASLLALLSYPFLFEPNLTLHQQATFWTVGFVLFCAGLAYTAYQVRRRGDTLEEVQPAEVTPMTTYLPEEDMEGKSAWKKSVAMVNISACGTVLLLAVTNQMTQDVASVPFLWVVPLSLYLLSFIVAFTGLFENRRGLMIFLMMIALFVTMLFLADPGVLPVWFMILVNSFVLFIGCLFCHNELYRKRPPADQLTSFYLMLALGGAMGGILVGVVAPMFFSDFWEFPAAMIIITDLIVAMAFQERRGQIYKLRITIVAVSLVLAGYILLLRFANFTNALEVSRNFYGVQRVRLESFHGVEAYSLVSGSIVHGIAPVDRSRLTTAPGYYTENSGAALAFTRHPARVAGQPIHAGILGLGTGTMAFYGQAGDTLRFYEIDPQVIRIANEPRYFPYLRDTLADVEIIEGDGRLSLEQELAEGQAQQFAILFIDAFSGDSVPTHLMSVEAIELYLQHLQPGGLLVFNISNKYLDLEPVLWKAKESLGLQGRFVKGTPNHALGFDSRWVILSQEDTFFNDPEVSAASRVLNGSADTRLWTDDYSNLFQVIQ